MKKLAVLATTAVVAALVPFTAAVPTATASVPRWRLHVQRFPGGISGGVRAAASDEAARARAAYRGAPISGAPSERRPELQQQRVLHNVQMNDDSNPPLPQNETSVAYKIGGPMTAVAASNDYVSGGVAIMRTSDGGRSWRTTRLVPQFKPTGDYCTGGDPSVAYSRRDRAFYLSQLCFFRELPHSEVQVFKSVDDGQTWTPGRQSAVAASTFNYRTEEENTSIFNDKELIAVDNTPTSPHYGRLYVTYTKFHIAADGSSDYCPVQLAYTDVVPTFDPSLTIFRHRKVVPDRPGARGLGESANQFSQPVVEPDGTLDISYMLEECNTALDHGLRFQKSTDGGDTFLPSPVHIDKPGQFRDNPDDTDLLPNKKFRAPGTTSMALNANTGTLVLSYQNNVDRARSGANISVSVSRDGGLNWSDQKFISTGPAGGPARNDQYFPAIATDQAGTFFAIWLDNRRDPANHDIDTFQAVSRDDGRTWQNHRISSVAWDPDNGFFKSGSFIGDYLGLAASDRVIYPVWMDGRASANARTGIGETDIFTNVEIR